MSADPVRNAAIDVLLRVFEQGAYLDAALDRTLSRKTFPPRGRRFLTHLVYGTVRHRLLCDYVLEQVVEQPLEKLPRPIHAVLRMGVFQALFCAQVPTPAMVFTSVELAKRRGHAGTARLANAVLKRVPASVDQVRLPDPAREPARYISVRHSLPEWLATRWLDELGFEGAEARAAAINVPAPVTLRVNTLRTTPDALRTRLEQSEYTVTKSTPIPEELTIVGDEPPARSKRYSEGEFFMQDPASMLPAHLLAPEAGWRVVDLCAAPGGKTTHLAQLAGDDADIVAMDPHPRKLMRVAENADRLGIGGIGLVCADGTRPPLGNGMADAVLVDAPCSGLGTLRKHPDLKWRVDADTPARLAETQCALLRSAAALCKNGGLIVYSVCTITREETEWVGARILEDGGLTPEDGPAWLEPWKIAPGTYQTRLDAGNMDGFFLMRWRKSS